MNAAELARNQQLDQFFVRDLNKEPTGWALGDQSVDAVVCCVSVQYLQQPEQVQNEIRRVLNPEGVCIFTFSNRMFYQKAIAAWRDASDYARTQLVRQYFQSVPVRPFVLLLCICILSLCSAPGFLGPRSADQSRFQGWKDEERRIAPKNPRRPPGILERPFLRRASLQGEKPFNLNPEKDSLPSTIMPPASCIIDATVRTATKT